MPASSHPFEPFFFPGEKERVMAALSSEMFQGHKQLVERSVDTFMKEIGRNYTHLPGVNYHDLLRRSLIPGEKLVRDEARLLYRAKAAKEKLDKTRLVFTFGEQWSEDAQKRVCSWHPSLESTDMKSQWGNDADDNTWWSLDKKEWVSWARQQQNQLAAAMSNARTDFITKLIKESVSGFQSAYPGLHPVDEKEKDTINEGIVEQFMEDFDRMMKYDIFKERPMDSFSCFSLVPTFERVEVLGKTTWRPSSQYGVHHIHGLRSMEDGKEDYARNHWWLNHPNAPASTGKTMMEEYESTLREKFFGRKVDKEVKKEDEGYDSDSTVRPDKGKRQADAPMHAETESVQSRDSGEESATEPGDSTNMSAGNVEEARGSESQVEAGSVADQEGRESTTTSMTVPVRARVPHTSEDPSGETSGTTCPKGRGGQKSGQGRGGPWRGDSVRPTEAGTTSFGRDGQNQGSRGNRGNQGSSGDTTRGSRGSRGGRGDRGQRARGGSGRGSSNRGARG